MPKRIRRAWNRIQEKWTNESSPLINDTSSLGIQHISSPLPPLIASIPGPSEPPSSYRSALTMTGDFALVGLRLLKETLDGVPDMGILKGPIGGFLAVVDIFKKKSEFDQALKDLDDYVGDLVERVFKPLSGKKEVEVPPNLRERLGEFSEKMQKVIERSELLKAGGAFKAYSDVNESCKIIASLGSEINEMLSSFTLEHQITIELARYEERLKDRVRNLVHEPTAYNSEPSNTNVGKVSRRRARFGNTAQRILAAVEDWIDNETGPPIFVLHGLAGVGKSTIAQTVAESRDAETCSGRHLGASFFFVRNLFERSDTFFPTIAFQLAEHDSAYIPYLGRYLDSILTVESKPLPVQLTKMILEPLRSIQNSKASQSLLIIDALDECNLDGAKNILELLVNNFHDIPLKVFITCRLEPHLKSALGLQDDTRTGDFSRFKLVDMMPLINRDDIRDFIESSLSEASMREEFPDCEWNVPNDVLDTLIRAAGSLFIMAATMVDFIKDEQYYNPLEQLRTLLRGLRKEGPTEASPYAGLDKVYTAILNASLLNVSNRRLLKRYRVVVGTIVLMQDPLRVPALGALVKVSSAEVEGAIRGLTSVIHRNNALKAPQTYHASFADFLTTSDRCGNAHLGGDPSFFIDPDEHHARIAGQCLDVMIMHLTHSNILELHHNEYFENCSEKIGSDILVDRYVPSEVLYACRYWADHLSRTSRRYPELTEKVELFASKHLLFWIEVLCWAGRLSEAQLALRSVTGESWSLICDGIFKDAQQFLRASYGFISVAPMHIYASALPSAPSQSALLRTYSSQAKNTIAILEGQPAEWPTELTTEAPQRLQAAVFPKASRRTYSYEPEMPDKSDIEAVGNESNLDVIAPSESSGLGLTLGNPHQPYSPPSGDQNSPSPSEKPFSEEGTGEGEVPRMSRPLFLTPPLIRYVPLPYNHADAGETPSEAVLGTPFYQYNPLLTFPYSYPPTNAAGMEENLFGTFASSSFPSFATYPGAPVISGSFPLYHQSVPHDSAWPYPGTPYVVPAGPFAPGPRLRRPEPDWIYNVPPTDAVDPDLPVTEVNQAALIWREDDVETTTSRHPGRVSHSSTDQKDANPYHQLAKSLVSSGQSASSVAFSSDGKWLVYARSDHSMRLSECVLEGRNIILDGHDDAVTAVSFSFDNQYLASASRDMTVRLWEVISGRSVAVLEGHEDEVNLVVFSPDGKLLASAARDGGVLLSDGTTGGHIAKLDGHRSGVTSLLFTSDGNRLASASDDRTIRLWDCTNGELVSELQGHTSIIFSLAFSFDGDRLASSSSDSSIRVWEGRSGELLSKLQLEQGIIFSVTFSPDGEKLACASNDGVVRVWDGVTGHISGLKAGERAIFSVAFFPGGDRIASASSDHIVRIWDLRSEDLVSEFPSHPSSLETICLLPPPLVRLVLSNENEEGLRCVGVISKDLASFGPPLYWLPGWFKVTYSWMLPGGGLFIAGEDERILVLIPNAS